MNPRPIFLGGELAELAVAGKTKPVLFGVVGVVEGRANIDFAALFDAIILGYDKVAGLVRVHIRDAAGLHGSGGGKKRNDECDTGQRHQRDEWTFHEGPPGKDGNRILRRQFLGEKIKAGRVTQKRARRAGT